VPPRFIDASVFVHAYLEPRRPLKAHESALRGHARAIVSRINRGETVVTSTVHLAEVANLLEDWMPPGVANSILLGLTTRENVQILPVGHRDFLEALASAPDDRLGTTDALARVLMVRHGLADIYSFDRDFDGLKDVRRISR
jgi:predicted nucleic acid-binding protein